MRQTFCRKVSSEEKKWSGIRSKEGGKKEGPVQARQTVMTLDAKKAFLFEHLGKEVLAPGSKIETEVCTVLDDEQFSAFAADGRGGRVTELIRGQKWPNLVSYTKKVSNQGADQPPDRIAQSEERLSSQKKVCRAFGGGGPM